MRLLQGGSGSGNFGHAGRPGQQGGSGPGGSSVSLENWFRSWPTNPTGDPEMITQQQRGFQKNEIVTELSKRSGLPYDQVNTMIRHWTHYAPGTGPETFFNTLVSEEWGVGNNGLSRQSRYQPGTPEEGLRLLHAMYDYTQEKLPKGDTFTLYRAIPGKREGLNLMQINPLSSWSTSEDTVKVFIDRNGGYRDYTIVKAEIPRDRIFGSSRTGFGAIPEEEIIVLGTPDSVQSVEFQSYYR